MVNESKSIPHNCLSSYKSYHHQSEGFSCSLNCHIGPPEWRWLLSLECLSCFEHTIQSLLSCHVFLVFILGDIPNHIPLKYRCLIKRSNCIKHVYLRWCFCGNLQSWHFLTYYFRVHPMTHMWVLFSVNYQWPGVLGSQSLMGAATYFISGKLVPRGF